MNDLIEWNPVLVGPTSDIHSTKVHIDDRAPFDDLCGFVLPVDLLAQGVLQCLGVVVLVHRLLPGELTPDPLQIELPTSGVPYHADRVHSNSRAHHKFIESSEELRTPHPSLPVPSPAGPAPA